MLDAGLGVGQLQDHGAPDLVGKEGRELVDGFFDEELQVLQLMGRVRWVERGIHEYDLAGIDEAILYVPCSQIIDVGTAPLGRRTWDRKLAVSFLDPLVQNQGGCTHISGTPV